MGSEPQARRTAGSHPLNGVAGCKHGNLGFNISRSRARRAWGLASRASRRHNQLNTFENVVSLQVKTEFESKLIERSPKMPWRPVPLMYSLKLRSALSSRKMKPHLKAVSLVDSRAVTDWIFWNNCLPWSPVKEPVFRVGV